MSLHIPTLKHLIERVTPLPWRWWTSNSMRRLSSDPSGKDGDVAHAYIARDGVPDIAVRASDAEYIEQACNALPELLSRLEAAERCVDALKKVEAALSDIGDADREPGDDLKWCERRAAEALPVARAALRDWRAAQAPHDS